MNDVIVKTNPFPGLRAFQMEEKDLFFGREKSLSELLAKLRDNRLLTVVGYAGSGKTSLMQCRLLPRLAQGFSGQGGDEWRVASFRPGYDPIGNLSLALAEPHVLQNTDRIEPNYADFLAHNLKRGGNALVNLFQEAQGRDKWNLLLYIDQFEDVFAFNEQEKNAGRTTNDASVFVNLLLNVFRRKDLPIYIALTVRSNELDKSTEFRGLPHLLNQGQFLVPQMKQEEIHQAIVAPLEAQKIKYEPELIERILYDFSKEKGQLPVLQHCMNRLWDTWQKSGEDVLQIEHYKEIGGLENAIANHADEIYYSLKSTEEQELCGRIFKILVEQGDGGLKQGKLTKFKTILNQTGVQQTTVLPILEAFSRKENPFLIAPPKVMMEPDAYISISNENIMRKWPRLSEWVKEEAESVAIYDRLAKAAVLHRNGDGGLWTDPELQLGLNWKAKAHPDAAWASRYSHDYHYAMRFLEESRQARDERLAIEREKAEREVKRARRIAFASILGLIFFLMIALVSGYFFVQAEISKRRAKEAHERAWASMLDAKESEQKANESKKLAEAETERAKKAEEDAEKERDIAKVQTQKAEKAKRKAEKEEKRAEAALVKAQEKEKEALEAKEEALEAKEEAIANAIKAKEAEEEAIRQAEETKRLQRISLAQSIAVKSLNIKDTEARALLANLAYGINAKNQGNIYDPYIIGALHKGLKGLKGSKYNEFASVDNPGPIWEIITEKENRIISQGKDGELLKWDALDPTAEPQILGTGSSIYRAMALSDKGKWLACVGATPNITLFNIDDASDNRTIVGHGRPGSNCVAFLPGDRGLFSAGNEGDIVYSNLENASIFVEGDTRINALDVSADGKFLVAGNEKGNVTVYKVARGGGYIASQRKMTSEITAIQFHPKDNKKIAIGLVDGDLVLWDLNDNSIHLEENHSARIIRIRYNRDGTKLITGSYDWTAKIWILDEIKNPSYLPLVLPHDSWVMSAAFREKTKSSNEEIITGTEKGFVRHWVIDENILVKDICEGVNRKLTEEEWSQFVGSNGGLNKEDYKDCVVIDRTK